MKETKAAMKEVANSELVKKIAREVIHGAITFQIKNGVVKTRKIESTDQD